MLRQPTGLILAANFSQQAQHPWAACQLQCVWSKTVLWLKFGSVTVSQSQSYWHQWKIISGWGYDHHGLSHLSTSRGNINNPKYYVCKLLSAMEINVWPASHAIWDLVSQLDGAWHWLRALSPKIYFPWLSQLSGLHCQLCKAWGPARLSVETIKLPTRKYWPYESLLVQHSRAAFLEFEGAT